MKRRSLLQLGGLAAIAAAAPRLRADNQAGLSASLTAKPGELNIVGPDFPATKVWGYDGRVPGRPLRLTRGDKLDITVHNALEVPTAVHWHGIRLPNAMDGVAGLTQPAILPGDSFRYEFNPPDAGTFWYHSHVNAYEQIGRGLYGPLIIDEPSPPEVDRDLVWMIDDWRLLDDASIRDDFGSGHDRSHAGRIGNVPTVNGRFGDVVKVRSGERLRLRLINASNARNFSLSFGDLPVTVIAVDGQPLTPYQPEAGIVIGAAGRTDLIIDMTGEPGSMHPVIDNFYRHEFKLANFLYEEKPLREQTLETPVALEPSIIPPPDLHNAIAKEITIAGGAMGGLSRAILNGEWMGLREIAQQGYVWAINDVVANKPDMPPLLSVERGQTVKLTLNNQTVFPHPMHLHGHHMQLLSIDGTGLPEPRWVDSPLLMPRQTMELAFVADNPGDWLFHCHALEHHAAGLGALIKVT
jgi:FtsP/CotA-like multicopper oxidase with cupredoxin domain